MCGRFFNHLSAMHTWVDILGEWPGEFATGYNISPTSAVPIVSQGGVCEARWGLVPPWAKEFGGKYPTHNARIETVHEKPSYRGAWNNAQTCLVPVGGYYEWVAENNEKQPYVVHVPDDIIVLAGLWDAWRDRLSFTVITRPATGTLADIHPRMPVMLSKNNAKQWLHEASVEALTSSVLETPTSYYRVGRAVNKSTATGPELIQKIS